MGVVRVLCLYGGIVPEHAGFTSAEPHCYVRRAPSIGLSRCCTASFGAQFLLRALDVRSRFWPHVPRRGSQTAEPSVVDGLYNRIPELHPRVRPDLGCLRNKPLSNSAVVVSMGNSRGVSFESRRARRQRYRDLGAVGVDPAGLALNTFRTMPSVGHGFEGGPALTGAVLPVPNPDAVKQDMTRGHSVGHLVLPQEELMAVPKVCSFEMSSHGDGSRKDRE